MQNDEKKPNGIQSIERAFRILETVVTAPHGCSLKYLAETLQLNKSTIHRLLHAMISWGYIRQTNDLYYAGFKILELSSYIRESFDLVEISKPYLTKLSKTVNMPVHLSVLNDESVIFINKIETPAQLIHMYSDIGKAIPAYCSSSGKAILAWLEQDTLEHYLSKIDLVPYTQATITNKETLISQLQSAVQKGYAYDWFEHENHIACVAAPIINDMESVIASISIAGTINQITPSAFASLAESVNSTAKSISWKLGCRRYPAIFNLQMAQQDALKYENTIRQLYINSL